MNEEPQGVAPEITDASGSCGCNRFRPAQPAQGEGPDVSDGCDSDGFPGGCARAGHTPETCPYAPEQAISAEERANTWLKEATLGTSLFSQNGISEDRIIESLIPVLTAHAAQEVSRVEGERDALEEMWQKIVSVALSCSPIPASGRVDNKLEPPWEVFARIKIELAQLRETLAQKEWKSADTAPKDGTHILAARLNRPDYFGQGVPLQTVVHYHLYGFYLSCYYPSDGSTDEPFVFTHWMDLPKAL